MLPRFGYFAPHAFSLYPIIQEQSNADVIQSSIVSSNLLGGENLFCFLKKKKTLSHTKQNSAANGFIRVSIFKSVNVL